MKEKMGLKRQLLCYARERAKWLLVLAAMALVFALVIGLYQLPLAAVGYAALLSAAIGGIAAALDFARYLKKQRQLDRLAASGLQRLEDLPAAHGQTEEQYQALLAALLAENAALRAEHRRQGDDMMDYYGLWVHQIKTPIAALRLLIQSGESSEKLLTSELNKVERYVQMALYYIRLENGGGDYVFGEYALDGILRKVIRQHAAQFIGKDIALDYSGIDKRVVTDEKWLAFALGQLVSNALKYTEAGTIRIAMEGPDTLVIADTGMGIQPSDLPRVCEMGYTGYNGRLEQRSTGLGLYLCKRVLANLSLTLDIESTPRAGTTVRVGFAQGEIFPE